MNENAPKVSTSTKISTSQISLEEARSMFPDSVESIDQELNRITEENKRQAIEEAMYGFYPSQPRTQQSNAKQADDEKERDLAAIVNQMVDQMASDQNNSFGMEEETRHR